MCWSATCQTDTDRLTGSTGGPIADAEGAFPGIQVFNRRMGAEVAIPADLALARAKLLGRERERAPALPRGEEPVGEAVKGCQ